MALESPGGASSASRKIRWLGIAVLVIVALYSAGWFFVASKFEDFLKANIAAAGEVDIECPGLATSGFPFLIGFNCDRTRISDGLTGDAMAAGALRAAARIYSPGAAVVELDGPAHVSLSDGSAFTAQWRTMRASFAVGLSRLKSFSASGEDLALNYLNAFLVNAIVAKAQHGEFHLRGNQDDVEAALLARGFEFGAEGADPILPALSTSLEVTAAGKAGLLEGKPMLTKAIKGQITSFKIEMSGGLFGELKGPYEIDDEGYLSGEFETHLEKLSLWETHLLRLFPDAGSTISGMAALLKGLAKGDDAVTVNLVVDRGTIMLSMVPIGHIPPI